MWHRKLCDFSLELHAEQRNVIQHVIDKGDTMNIQFVRYMTALATVIFGSFDAVFAKGAIEQWTHVAESQEMWPLLLNLTLLTEHLGVVAMTSAFVYESANHTIRLTNALQQAKED